MQRQIKGELFGDAPKAEVGARGGAAGPGRSQSAARAQFVGETPTPIRWTVPNSKCAGCGGPKPLRAFFCRHCWARLDRKHRRALFATRYKPVAHAKVVSEAVALIKYGPPESESVPVPPASLFSGRKDL